jgi:hypothetical protein
VQKKLYLRYELNVNTKIIIGKFFWEKIQGDIMKNKKVMTLALMIIALILCIGLIEVAARPNGITNVSTSGCTCHNPTPAAEVTVTLTGYPTEYDPDTKYTLTITITGGPAPTGVNQGGFNLKVSAGTLAVPTGANDIQIIGGEATHTSAGNDQRSWDIEWTAPGEGTGDVTFTFAGNSVNGDGTNSGDKWNKGSSTIPEKVPDDTAKPTIQITSPVEDQSFPPETTSILVSGTAADNVQVSRVEVSTDGSTWKAATGTTDWSATVDVQVGANVIYARAKDSSDNIGNDMVNITVLSPPMDDKKPSITITEPVEDQTFPEGTLFVEMKGTASDNVAVVLVEVSNDNTIWTPAVGLTSWNATMIVQTGPNTFYARATDEAANSKTVMVNITVKASTVDTEPPNIQITKPIENEEFPAGTTTVEIEGTASDNEVIEKVEVSTDKVNWNTANGKANWNSTVEVTIGINTIYARAFDSAGNSVIDSVNFSLKEPVDTIPPNVVIISPTEEESFPFGTEEVEVEGTANDDGTVNVVKVSLDGINYETAIGENEWTYTISVEPGEYEIIVMAEDLNGNTAKRYVNFSVLADTSLPTLKIESHPSGIKVPAGTKNILLTGSASDNDELVSVEVSTDNSSWTLVEGTTSWSVDVELSTGKNIIYFRATDASENSILKQIEINVPEEQSEDDSGVYVIILVIVIIIILVIFGFLYKARKR